MSLAMTIEAKAKDPRDYQLLVLGSFILLGTIFLGFQIPLARFWVYLGVCVWTQCFWTIWYRAESFQWKSALITSFSLSLLLRTVHWTDAALLAFVAISSKFLLRNGNRPFFNPAHFGICFGLLFFPQVWVSPGQWGSFAFFTLLALCLGSFVSGKAHRLDVSLSFLGTWGVLLFMRSFWLNEPMVIPFHRIQTGATLLFAFHMISDPMTTPRLQTMRVVYGGLVAFVAFYIQFSLFRTNGLFWSLLFFAPMVKILDLFSEPSQAASLNLSMSAHA